MTTDEHALASWLDQPAGTEPDGLDSEALEAVYALRPDLAPAPRVTADDILATVAEGPLAVDSGRTVPTSLPGPDEQETVTDLPAPANRSLAAWGGLGGIGLAMAAAATFLLVAVPTFQGQAPESAPSPAATERAPAAPAAPPPPPPPAGGEAATDDAKPAAAPRPSPKPRPATRTVAEPPPPAEPAVADGAYDMAADAPLRQQNLIPELAEEADGVAEVELKDEEQELGADDAGPDLDALRADAVASSGPAGSWQAGLPAGEVKRLTELFDAAATQSSTDPRAAADAVAVAIQAPSGVAHHAADLAVSYYLAAGDPSAAASAALRGLQFRTDGGSWARLAVRYADLLRNSDPAEAARWYEDAAAAGR